MWVIYLAEMMFRAYLVKDRKVLYKMKEVCSVRGAFLVYFRSQDEMCFWMKYREQKIPIFRIDG